MTTIDEIQNWIWTYQKTVEDCEKQIARLEPVYQELGDIKNDFRSVRKNTEVIFEQKGVWRGEKYTSFCRSGATLDEHCGEYYKRLDAAQDSVNRRIAELKAKKWEMIPLINSLVAQFENMKAEIENARN